MKTGTRPSALKALRALTGLDVIAVRASSAGTGAFVLADGTTVGFIHDWFDGSAFGLARINAVISDLVETYPGVHRMDRRRVGRVRRAIADYLVPERLTISERLGPDVMHDLGQVAVLREEAHLWPGWRAASNPVGACWRCGRLTRIADPTGRAVHPHCP